MQDPSLEPPYLALSLGLQGLAADPSSRVPWLLQRGGTPWHPGLGLQTHFPLFHCISLFVVYAVQESQNSNSELIIIHKVAETEELEI